MDDYENVLKRFYGEELYTRLIDARYFYTLRIYREQKVALIGLNSCMLKPLSLEKEEIEWIEGLANFSDKQKHLLREALEEKKKSQWDDYGEIDVLQLDEAFTRLREEVGDPGDYTLVACFHHHFYPFPEMYERFGDSSLMRNFTEVVENLQGEKVKLVLHGHKHLPIIRPVANEYCLHHPDSVLYVLAAGSACCAETVNRSFQVVEVYGPKENVLANICRFNYKDEQLEDPEYFEIPPRREEERASAIELETLFKKHYREEYERYKREIYEADYLSSHNRIRFILENISRVILCLKCTDPTIHKIAVLIAKDFEKRMVKLEEYFRLLDIKLYYLSPKVEKTRYDLDNFNFEAYIPKLLPLLIGEVDTFKLEIPTAF